MAKASAIALARAAAGIPPDGITTARELVDSRNAADEAVAPSWGRLSGMWALRAALPHVGAAVRGAPRKDR